jgi:hypothetical protein
MNRRRIVLGLALAAVLSIATVCCIQHGEEAERASAAHGTASSGDEVAAQPSGAAPALAELARASDAGMPDASDASNASKSSAREPKAAPQGNAVARAMRATDAHDRTLLADIERQTKKPPPKAVHALLALRKEGKSRAELERFIAAQLAGDVVVRMLTMRWLDGRETPAIKERAPILRSAPELDGPRQLQPITNETAP